MAKKQARPKLDLGTTQISQDNEALARALADYQNLQKRVEREKFEILTRANKNTVEELLPVLDQLKRAQTHLKDSGLEMALEQFKSVLTRCGVETIPTKAGDTFNASLHEAIEAKDGGQSGIIINVLEDGHRWLDGQVIRPAKVAVYK